MRIEELNLSHSRLDCCFIEALASHMFKVTCLEDLDLCENRFCDKGARLLAFCRRQLPFLKELHVTSSYISAIEDKKMAPRRTANTHF